MRRLHISQATGRLNMLKSTRSCMDHQNNCPIKGGKES